MIQYFWFGGKILFPVPHNTHFRLTFTLLPTNFLTLSAQPLATRTTLRLSQLLNMSGDICRSVLGRTTSWTPQPLKSQSQAPKSSLQLQSASKLQFSVTDLTALSPGTRFARVFSETTGSRSQQAFCPRRCPSLFLRDKPIV